MKKTVIFAFAFLCAASMLFAGKTVLADEAQASYYGAKYDGRPTSSGEIFDMYAMTCAHKTLPFGTMLEVVNLDNGNSVIVRVNDRGPFVQDREIDLSYGAAEKLGMITSGLARVSVAIVDEAYVLNATSSVGTAQVASDAPALIRSDARVDALPVAASVYAEIASDTDVVYASEEASGALWRIQLGSFTREENALRMVRSLRSVGLDPAYEKTDGTIRVVLASVADSSLDGVKETLSEAGFRDYLLRRER